jgi:hypothetical protein
VNLGQLECGWGETDVGAAAVARLRAGRRIESF